jgi:hypothetical protein
MGSDTFQESSRIMLDAFRPELAVKVVGVANKYNKQVS